MAIRLTEEQKNIVESSGDIKINAVAGSGKTTTLVEYARARQDNRILYLAFNSSVKKSAREKFSQLGLKNVRVETAHSLAFSDVVRGSNYKIESGYKTSQIKDILGLNPNSHDRSAGFVMANHIKKFAAYYCNSSASKVQELDYRMIVTDPVAKAFVNSFYDEIEYGTRLLLAKMLRGEISITHDFYLKLFQLRNPRLNYDCILFDEGQDASPAMLDVFLRQNSTKIIVGDTNQQIYGWRYAINSLQKVEGFRNMTLTTSFRLDEEIAELAMNILKWKEHFTPFENNHIRGLGRRDVMETRAVIARTNLKLLAKAIGLATSVKPVGKIYFEGNLNSYTYASEGASLYDVLNLSNGSFHLIRDDMIRNMKSIDELKEYADKSEETELMMMIEMVNEYGRDLPRLMKLLKEKHVADNDRSNADVIFSTVHRCKGMEYDEVTLEKDFVNEESILKLLKREGADNIDADSLSEEINLLYVAVTRTRTRLKLPEELTNQFMKGLIFNSRKHILVSPGQVRPALDRYTVNLDRSISRKEFHFEMENWTEEMDSELERRVARQMPIHFIAKYFCTTRKAVRIRINQLGLIDKYDLNPHIYY